MLGRLAQFFGLKSAVTPVDATDKPKSAGATIQLPLFEPNAPATTPAERKRVIPAAVPPLLESFATQYPIVAMIRRIRAGRSAVAPAEKEQWERALWTLDAAQRNLVRDLLVIKPPHQDLARLNGRGVLKGPATVHGLMSILTGDAFGWQPAREAASPRSLEEAMVIIERHVSGTAVPKWRETISESEPLARLTQRLGLFGLKLIEVFGHDFAASIQESWSAVHVLGSVAIELPQLLPHFVAERERVGEAALLSAVERLDEAASALSRPANELLETFGVRGALSFGVCIANDPHATRALRALVGTDEMIALGKKDLGALSQRLNEAKAQVASFGSDGTPLCRGANWPQPTHTPGIAAAEARVLSALGLRLDVLTDLSKLDVASCSRLIQTMRGQLGEDRLAELDRELLGRRFVSPRYYDALYADGVKNPEHRYSIKTFEAWRNAAVEGRRSAEASRGRDLKPGELIDVMQRLHRLAGLGMVEVHESHLKPEDLGRIRSKDEDHVQLGETLHRVDAEVAKRLDANPFLQRFDAFKGTDGEHLKHISFAVGSAVPSMVKDLDDWVRANEKRLPPEVLAAEVHHRLVSIHPFMDGNGRTSKLIADFLLARAGIEPPLWRESEVLSQADRWHEVLQTGVRFHLETVLRHWQAGVA